MSGFPIWRSSNGRRNPQRIRLWSPLGFDCRTLTGLGETETPLLEGTHKILCAPGPRGKEQWPHRSLNQTYLLALEGFLGEWGWLWLTVGPRTLAAEVLGSTHWWEPSWSLPLALPKSLQTPVLGHLRPQNQQGGNTAQPISRQVDESFTELCPTKQHPVPPTTSASHQEACTSLLDSLIHQREESRSKKNYNPLACRKNPKSPKDRQNEKAQDYVPDEGKW